MFKNFFKGGDYSERCPKYCVKRLTLKEMAESCIGKKVDLVCKNVPYAIKSNAVYVIDINCVPLSDLSVNGFIYNKHSCPTPSVEVVYHHDNLVACKIVSAKENKTENIYTMRRQYSYASTVSKTDAELKRTITRFEDGNDKTCQYAIISYKFNVNGLDVGEAAVYELFQKAHGNSKQRREPYNRTYPSVINRIKKESEHFSPKNVVSNIHKQAGAVFEMSSPFEVARDRMQIYNAARNVDKPKHRNTGKPKTADFGKLNILLLKDDFVKDIAYRSNPEKDYLQPSVFATTDTHMNWIKAYCLAENPKAVLGVDMTYKCGLFYVTPLTMKYPMFVKKNDPLSHPGVAVALATSATKEYENYKFLAEKISKFVAGKPIVYGTDGEQAIEKAFEKEFPIEDVASAKQSVHLRCFAHVETDMEKFLSAETSLDGKSRNKVIADILGTEFDSVRYK